MNRIFNPALRDVVLLPILLCVLNIYARAEDNIKVTHSTFVGRASISVENNYIKMTAVPEIGAVVQLVNKRTGSEHLYVREPEIPLGRPCMSYAWMQPLEFSYKPYKAEVIEQENQVSLILSTGNKEVQVERKFTIRVQSSSIEVTETIRNIGNEAQMVSTQPVFHLATAAGGFFGKDPGTRYSFRLFFKIHDPLPERSFSASGVGITNEAIEQLSEKHTYNTHYYPNVEWLAVVDQAKHEGIAFLMESTGLKSGASSNLKLEHQFFDSAIWFSSPQWQLQPGQLQHWSYHIIMFEGLDRVDQVDKRFLAAINMNSVLFPREQQKAVLEILALQDFSFSLSASFTSDKKMDNIGHRGYDIDIVEPKKVSDKVLLKDEKVSLSRYAKRSWQFESPPYPYTMEFTLYAQQALEVFIDDVFFKRAFTVSPDAFMAMTEIDSILQEAKGLYDAGKLPAEAVGAIIVFQRWAQDHKKESIEINGQYREQENAEFFYRMLRNARCVLEEFKHQKDWHILPVRTEIQEILRHEPNKSFFQQFKADVDTQFFTAPPLDIWYASRTAFIYAATGERKYAQKTLETFKRVYEEHRKQTYIHFWNGLQGGGNAGRTPPGFVQAYDWLGDYLTPEEHSQILDYLFWDMQELAPLAHAYTGNWEISEGNSLLWMALRFAYLPFAREIQERAESVLKWQLAQVCPDGGWLEESPGYHIGVLTTLIDAAEVSAYARTGFNLYKPVDGISLKDMVYWLWNIMDPNDYLPPLEDSGFGLPPVSPFIFCAKRYNDSALLGIAERLLRKGRKITSPLEILAYPYDMQPVQPTHPLALEQTGTGRVVLRSGNDSEAQYFVFDYGPHGAWHGHPDKLSFELHAFGQALAVDAGSGNYYGAQHWEWNRSTKAHNTVAVDRKNQLETEGHLKFLVDFPDVTFVEASAQTYPDVWHTRTIIAVRGKYYVISDSLTSDIPHTYSSYLHSLGTLTKAANNDSLIFWKFLDTTGIGLTAVTPANYDTLSAIGIWQHDRSASYFSLTTEKQKSATFSMLLSPFKGIEEKKRVHLIRGNVDVSAGRLYYLWTVDEDSTLMLTNYSGNLTGTPRRDVQTSQLDVSTDARALFLRTVPNDFYVAGAELSEIKFRNQTVLRVSEKALGAEINMKRGEAIIQTEKQIVLQELMGRKMNRILQPGKHVLSLQ